VNLPSNHRLVEEYISYLRELLYENIKDHKILIDCGNGSNSIIAKEVLKGNNNVDFIFCNPNGNNINLGCGALEYSNCYNSMKKNDYDYGVVFDGDGDRVL